MAGSSLFALLDDIATVMDDVAILAKVAAKKTGLAAKKTAGVLGDDIALNAEQVAGVSADRELPVIWAVFKGSALNKVILVPSALAISVFLPMLIVPLLIIGGLYLCFEGVEKVIHSLYHKEEKQAHKEALSKALLENQDLMAFERDKIKGAIRTDFVLSAEIIVIALGTVAEEPFATQATVVTAIAALMTVGVYAFVAAVVKLDDLGLYLSKKQESGPINWLGAGLLNTAPLLMKLLSVLGTLAMFLVGGGIMTHGIPWLQHWSHEISSKVGEGLMASLTSIGIDAVVGVLAGAVTLVVVSIGKKLFSKG